MRRDHVNDHGHDLRTGTDQDRLVPRPVPAAYPIRRVSLAVADIEQWCVKSLGAQPAEMLFERQGLSTVIGLELSDHQQIVVKIRPAMERIKGCVEVQHYLWQQGFPCPEPLAGPEFIQDTVITAESLVQGGDAACSWARFAGTLRDRPRAACRFSAAG